MASLLSQTVGSLIYIPDPWFRKSEKIINYENTIKIPNSKTITAEVSEDFKQNLKFLGLKLPKNLHDIFI